MRDQGVAQARQSGHAHVEGQGLLRLRQRGPVVVGIAILRVRSQQVQRLRMLAMGQRDAGIGRAGDGSSDAGHDFEGDAVRA